jgi:hypothetical protein
MFTATISFLLKGAMIYHSNNPRLGLPYPQRAPDQKSSWSQIQPDRAAKGTRRQEHSNGCVLASDPDHQHDGQNYR